MSAAKLDPGVEKCIGALNGAKNDTEKMAALFLVTKVVKAPSLNRENRLALFNAIGFKFLLRLLNTPSSPDCPSLLYKSVALSILSTFCSDPTIASSPEMLEAVPIFMKIVQESAESGDDEGEELLVVANEAYHCLSAVATTEKGGDALVKTGAISVLISIYTKQDVEEVLGILKNAGRTLGTRVWGTSSEDFNTLMDRISLNFEVEQSEHKFELCDVMASLMTSYNMTPEAVENAFWPASVLKGLIDILSSKITEKQRNPALKLASVMLTTLGVDWMLKTSEQGSKAYQFLVLLVNLSCIELRMTLEDRTLDKILPKEDLIGSCYGIIETTITFMTGHHFEFLDEKQKEQLYASLKGGASAILSFLNLLQTESGKNPKFWDGKKKVLACASVRCLGAWLAEESATLKEEMYKLLPFVLSLAFEDFQDAELSQSAESLTMAEMGKSTEPLLPDLLCLLLPALCHLTAAEEGATILLKAKGDDLLFRFLSHNWSVYKYISECLEKKGRFKKQKKGGANGKAGGGKDKELDFEVLESTQLKIRASLIHTCNLFINLTVHNPKTVNASPVFQQMMRWAFTALPSLTNPERELILLSNIAGLGLLLLFHVTKKVGEAKGSLSPEEEFQSSLLISGTDNSVFRFGQGVVRFVWDAHQADESQSPVTLILASNYRAVWTDVKEMWFLSLQTLGALMEVLPWLGDFAAESGFLDALIGNLSKAYKNSIEAATLAAYEDFLGAAIKGGEKASKIIKTKGAALASSHHLRALKKALDQK